MLEQTWTVPASSMAVMALVVAFTLLFPLALGIVFWRRARGRWRFFWMGCVVFPLFALGLEGAVNRAVLYGPAGGTIAGNLGLYALFGGLMAGLFEECGRWCALRLGKRWARGPQDALMYGAGHGGIEAALLAGSAMLSNLLVCFALNKGGLAGAAALMGAESLTDAQTAALASLVTTPAGMYLWSAFERAVAIAIHVSLSVLVYRAVQRNRARWLLLAVLLHAGVDASSIAAAAFLPIAGVELVALLWAAGLVLLARKIYFLEKQENPLTFPQGEGV